MSNNLNIQSEIFKLLNDEYPEFNRKINISDYVVPTVSSSTIRINRRTNSNLLHFKLNSGISGNIKIDVIGESTNNHKVYDIYGEEITNLSSGNYDAIICLEYFVILNRYGLSESTLSNYNLIQEVIDNMLNNNIIIDGGKFEGILNNSITENKLSPGIRNKLNREFEIENNSISESKLSNEVKDKLNKEFEILDDSINMDKLSSDVKNELLELKKSKTTWVNIKEHPYYAKGDGVSDDTNAFNTAVADLVNKGGGVIYCPYVPIGYGITSINIPIGVTLLMEKGKFMYAVENWSLDVVTNNLVTNAFIKLDNSPIAISSSGTLTNVRLNGNRKSGIGVRINGGNFEDLRITRMKGTCALSIASPSYEYKSLYLGGNMCDAMHIEEGVADTRLELFNIWLNNGHGIVFKNGVGTINFADGKIEWNFKNNIHVEGYTHEITFDNCIIDAPTWYNVYCPSNSYMSDWKFTSCNFIGGRRRANSTTIYGETVIPDPPYTNNAFSMLYFDTANVEVDFIGCLFRKLNAKHEAGAQELITHILGGRSGLNITNQITINSCDCSDFNYSNWKIGFDTYTQSIIGTRFLDSPLFTGGVVSGEILLPLATGNLITNYHSKKSGGVILNTDDKSLDVWLWGNMYKFKSNGYVNPPTSQNSPGITGNYSADANYLYVCFNTNSWIRVAKSSW